MWWACVSSFSPTQLFAVADVFVAVAASVVAAAVDRILLFMFVVIRSVRASGAGGEGRLQGLHDEGEKTSPVPRLEFHHHHRHAVRSCKLRYRGASLPRDGPFDDAVS